MSNPNLDDAQKDRDANDCVKGVSAVSFMSTGIFFVIMQGLRLAHETVGLGCEIIYVVAALYFVLTIAFFAYGLSENFELLRRFVLLRRKAIGEVTFRVSLVLFSLMTFFCVILTIFIVGFVPIIDKFIDSGNVRSLLVMHLAVPYAVRVIFLGVCEFDIVQPIDHE